MRKNTKYLIRIIRIFIGNNIFSISFVIKIICLWHWFINDSNFYHLMFLRTHVQRSFLSQSKLSKWYYIYGKHQQFIAHILPPSSVVEQQVNIGQPRRTSDGFLLFSVIFRHFFVRQITTKLITTKEFSKLFRVLWILQTSF